MLPQKVLKSISSGYTASRTPVCPVKTQCINPGGGDPF